MRASPGLALLALLLLRTAALAGQVAPAPGVGATLRGTVTDSLAGGPLAGATVQLVASGVAAPSARSTVSDPQGRFVFAEVATGQYLLGFLHPLLDSLGLEPILRAVTVSGTQEVRADLAVPSAARVKGALCAEGVGPGGTSGVVTGVVRAAEGGVGVPGATVRADWLEYTIGQEGIGQRAARRVATTGAGGEYVLCDVPSPGSVMLRVSLGEESTDWVEEELPPQGLLRRDLFLGEARSAPLAAVAAPDSLPPRALPRTGPGRLSGTVLSTEGGQPLVGARVGVVDGTPTLADAQGRWTLSGVPSGTRVLEVRAPGYYPLRRVVNIADGAPPVHLRLSRLTAMLDTLRVVARGRIRDTRLRGFEERRRSSGAGRFLTAADIGRRRVWSTTDLFTMIPGLRQDRDAMGDEVFYMRSAYGESCMPAVFIDGALLQNLSSRDLNALVRPGEIAGLEVYRDPQVPPQFQGGMMMLLAANPASEHHADSMAGEARALGTRVTGCGSIVIWTK